MTKEDRERFLRIKNENFSEIFAHSSYWVNLATGNPTSSKISKALLKKEISISQKLKINHLVVHAGSAKNHSKQSGIEAVANILNEVLVDTKITILVENTTHGGQTVCSDLQDFVELKSLITKPEQVKFCLDTAHAFSYGYDMKDLEHFVELLDSTMGTENIKLIHLNDSKKACQSRIDEHEIPGDGLIGQKILNSIVNHEKLQNIPIIIEPPTNIETQTIKKSIENIKEWRGIK